MNRGEGLVGQSIEKYVGKKLRIVVDKRTEIGFKLILLLIKGFMPEW